MPVQRLPVDRPPHIELAACQGDVLIRRSNRAEVSLESDDDRAGFAERERHLLIDAVQGDCTLRLPRGSQVTLGEVQGTLRIKDVDGFVDVERVFGDCSTRRTGALSIRRVEGGARIRSVAGPVTVGAIQGDVMLRDVSGLARVEYIGGDVYGRDLPFGASIGRVGGDLFFQTDYNPGLAWQIAVDGDATFHVPEHASVRFTIPFDVDLDLEKGLEALDQEGFRVVLFGKGAAAAEVSANGSLAIKRYNQYNNRGEDFADILEEDVSVYLHDLTEKFDERFAELDGDLRDRLKASVRDSVQRSLKTARRAARRAGRVRPDSVDWGSAVGSPPGRGPVSDEERMAILNMLEARQITVEEADRLLAALEGRAEP
ncbi:MAG: hypothetical protein P8Z40_00265 [Chloroflexota bacterium]